MKKLGLIICLMFIASTVLAQGLPALQKTEAQGVYETLQKNSAGQLTGEINRVKWLYETFWVKGYAENAETGVVEPEFRDPEVIEELMNMFGASYIQKSFGWHEKRQEGLYIATGGTYEILTPPAYEITVRETDGYICVDGCPVDEPAEVDEGIYE